MPSAVAPTGKLVAGTPPREARPGYTFRSHCFTATPSTSSYRSSSGRSLWGNASVGVIGVSSTSHSRKNAW